MNFLKQTIENPEHLVSKSMLLENGTRLETLATGVLRVRPPESTNNVSHRAVISSGIHGNETAPIEIVDTLVRDIANGELTVRNELLFIIGNPAAVSQQARFVEENLNRLFSQKHKSSQALEASRAAELERFVDEFFNEGNEPRLHYDLHTAIRGSEIEKFAVYPFLHERTHSQPQLGFLESCGIEAALLSNQPSGTFSYFSSRGYGADAFTIELGKVRKFGENDMASFSDINAGLRRVISGEEAFARKPKTIKLFSVVEEVIKRTEAFKLHVAPDAKNFSEFDAGVILASDHDYEYRTQTNGERFVFPISNVPCGQRAMLVVAPTQLTDIVPN